MSTNENLLDELYTLQKKRAANVRKNGETFQTVYGNKEFLGIIQGQKTLIAEDSAQLRPGLEISGPNGTYYYVGSVIEKAGVKECAISRIHGRLDIFRETELPSAVKAAPKIRLQPVTVNIPILKFKNDSINIPISDTPADDAILKIGSSYYAISYIAHLPSQGQTSIGLKTYDVPGAAKTAPISYIAGSGKIPVTTERSGMFRNW